MEVSSFTFENIDTELSVFGIFSCLLKMVYLKYIIFLKRVVFFFVIFFTDFKLLFNPFYTLNVLFSSRL